MASSCSSTDAHGLSLVGSKVSRPKAGTLRAGQWIWYRSITSVCRRRRLSSQALRISALLTPEFSPRIHGMPRDGPATLVASTTLPRRLASLANQLPRIVSVAPQVSARAGTEYISAASRKWIPRSIERSRMLCAVASSTCSPNVIVPRQMGGTCSALAPNGTFFMQFFVKSGWS